MRDLTTNHVFRPVYKAPAFIRHGGQGDHIAIVVRGLIGSFRDRAVANFVDRECIFILGEGNGDSGIAMDRYLPPDHIRRPAAKAPTGSGVAVRVNHIAIVIGGLIRDCVTVAVANLVDR